MTRRRAALGLAFALSWAAASPASASESAPFDLEAYLQVDYVAREDSRDASAPDGELLNRDGFALRRGRLRAQWQTGFARALLELDAGTGRTHPVLPRRAEAVVAPEDWLILSAGLIRPSFGAELPLGNEARLFLERTEASRAFFPGETDLGAALGGRWRALVWSLGLYNGAPARDGRLPFGADPSAAHDLLGRVGLSVDNATLKLDFGASYLTGRGLNLGHPATKAGLAWSDLDEDSVVDDGELAPVPGRAATAPRGYERWAVNADTRLELSTPLGGTTLTGEVTLATNLDRSGAVADPISRGFDQRGLAASVGLTHRWRSVLAGFRWDSYAPDLDRTESRRGGQVPVDVGVTTLSPVVGVAWGRSWRLVAQLDRVIDHAGRDARGVPTDRADDRVTLRLQAGQ